MSLPLKVRGMTELMALKRRVLRQRALGRISRADYEYIRDRLDEIEAHIIQMRETNENEMEIDDDGSG